MKAIFALLATIWLTTSAYGANAPICKKWFVDSKLKSDDRSCETKCTVLATGMDTFLCPRSCSEFCRSRSYATKMLGSLLYYPGLNPEEQRLVKEFPLEALSVFTQKGIAESRTEKVFGRDAQEDESDAFRHFVWAGLLSKEIGPDAAKKFLDAHEASRRSDDPNRAMDLANNRAGLLSGDRLRKEGKLTLEELEKDANASLRNKTLVVLKPRGGVP